MTSTAASAPTDMSERSDREIPRWRLHVLRAIALLFVVSGFFSYSEMLIHASATDRATIKAFLTCLWLMPFLAVRFPLKMLPIFFFKSTPDGRSFR